jgi:hypothetical protein
MRAIRQSRRMPLSSSTTSASGGNLQEASSFGRRGCRRHHPTFSRPRYSPHLWGNGLPEERHVRGTNEVVEKMLAPANSTRTTATKCDHRPEKRADLRGDLPPAGLPRLALYSRHDALRGSAPLAAFLVNGALTLHAA